MLSAGTGVTVNLVAHSTTGGATDTLTAIENVEGTTYADTITGDTVANVIWGLAGDDVLDGGGATTGARITSYNVCYTKLLRLLAMLSSSRRRTSMVLYCDSLARAP